eukprot:Awhi_evm1s6186
MVTGKMPYDTPHRTLRGEYHKPLHISPECLKILGDMMIIEKSERPDVEALHKYTWLAGVV